MSRITNLPQELLLIIFDHVDSTAQMAQCKLVCRAWNQIAQPLLLTKDLTITSEQKANQLYDYLVQNPQYATMIKTMHVNIRYSAEDAGFVRLASLAFTPTMQSLTGHAESSRFFNKLMENASISGADAFNSLKCIPYLKRNGCDAYDAALILFKDTLESARLTFYGIIRWNLINQLPNFKRLKKLYLELAIRDVTQLDPVLDKCSQVEELSIQFNQGDPTDRLLQNVSWVRSLPQNHNVKALYIYGECRIELTDYLMFKHPNVDRVQVDLTQRDAPWDSFHSRVALNASGICNIVNTLYVYHVPSFFSLKFRLSRGGNLKLIKDCITHHGGQVLVCESVKQKASYRIPSNQTSLKITECIHYLEVSNNAN